MRRRTIDLAIAPTSKEAQLLHRYEREHEKSLYAAIRGLLSLEKSGADLPDGPGRARARSRPQPRPSRRRPGRSGPEKPCITHDISSSCVKLASVGEPAPAGVRPGRSAGSPGRPGRPNGADPGPWTAPKRR